MKYYLADKIFDIFVFVVFLIALPFLLIYDKYKFR
ncbi:hypothetical protein UFOVP136_17 [uncultured Caudovirales phage]|uniref:Uncharacterized protein n=1 Tax=uncultured Caudovirales phage TaxID=2100421 RepID=A0A6J5LBZ1_9CAUD|nr:hypothetical protein UFOVP136_17 [uncultured Caudovirales phage]